MTFNPQSVERLYAISTAHLPLHLLDNLDAFMTEPESMVIVQKIEYGALLWVPEGVEGDAWFNTLTLDEDKVFAPIVAWAQKHGLRWIKFDCDAPEMDDLPQFDHEQAQVD
jgi:hypothetical protein